MNKTTAFILSILVCILIVFVFFYAGITKGIHPVIAFLYGWGLGNIVRNIFLVFVKEEEKE